MTIRWANPTDAPALAELYRLVWSAEVAVLGERLAGERQASADEIRGWIENEQYLVVEADGAIAAALGCERRHGTLHLVHLAVHPLYRRRGCARSLLARAEDFARQVGAGKVWFDTAPGLEAAARLYESLNYKQCGYLRRHYWGTDVVLYEKLL